MGFHFWFSASAVGIMSMWPWVFSIMIVNQMYDLLKKFLAKNMHVTSAFLWSFFVSGPILFLVIGNSFSSLLIDKFGRKGTLVIASFPAMLALFLEYLSYQLEHPILLFVGKFMVGFVAGLCLVSSSIFLSETSPPGTRGARSASGPLYNAIGYLLSAILCIESLMGNEKIWNYMFLIPLCTTFLCLLYLYSCPETPMFLKCVKKDDDLAKQSMKFYFSKTKLDELTDEDMDMFLHQSIGEMRNGTFGLKEGFWNKVKELIADKKLRISVIISLTMAVDFATSSFVLLSSYSTAILESLGTSTSLAKKFTILLAASTVVAVFTANYLIEKVGRRCLLVTGTFGCSVLLASLGVLCQIGQSHSSTAVQWLAAIIIVLCSFMGRSCIFTVFLVLIPEIFPYRTRTTAMALAGSLNDICDFIVLFLFYPIYHLFPLLAFGSLALPTFVCGTILWKFCPETKGKGVDLILAEINGEIYGNLDADNSFMTDKDTITEKTSLIH